MEELWMPVVGSDGGHEVSYDGFIRKASGVLLKGYVNPKGYMVTHISVNGVKRKYRLSQLVAQAWIPNPEGYPEVDHISENKTNNGVNNLRWCTNEMNKKWYWDNHKERKAKVYHTCRVPEFNAKAVRVNNILYYSAGSAAKMIADIEGKSQTTISKEIRRMLQGKRGEWEMYGKYLIQNP